jgi:hypothetical protein
MSIEQLANLLVQLLGDHNMVMILHSSGQHSWHGQAISNYKFKYWERQILCKIDRAQISTLCAVLDIIAPDIRLRNGNGLLLPKEFNF